MSGPAEPDIGPVDPANASRNRAGGMVVLTGANALYIASAYVITVWLAHDLGPRDFGRYGVATAVVTLITIVVTRGVPVSATREIAADPVRARGTMLVAGRVMIPLALGITALGALAAYPISQILRDDKLFVPLLIGSAAAITYAAQALPLAWFTGMHDYARQTAAQSWYAVSRLGAIIVGALLAGLAGAMAGFVIAPLIAALATLGGLRLLRRDRGGSAAAQAAPPSVTRRRLLREAGPLVLVAGLITLFLTLDLLAFKRVGTAADAGRYAAAATIAHVPFFLLRSASIILMPAVAAAAMAGSSRDPRSPRVQAEIRHGIGDAIVLLALPTALLITLGDRALDLIFGERYAVNGLVVAPLAIATAAITLYSVFVAVEIALGRLRIAAATGALGAVLVMVAALLGGQGSNVSRAAWAVAAAAVFAVLVHTGTLWARTGSFVAARSLVAVPLAAAVAAPTLLTPDGVVWFLVAALAASAVYVAVALRLGLVKLR